MNPISSLLIVLIAVFSALPLKAQNTLESDLESYPLGKELFRVLNPTENSSRPNEFFLSKKRQGWESKNGPAKDLNSYLFRRVVGHFSPLYGERASNGGERGGGGDALEIRFRQIAEEIYQKIQGSRFFQNAFMQKGLAIEDFQQAYQPSFSRIAVVDDPPSVGYQDKSMVTLPLGVSVKIAESNVSLPYNLFIIYNHPTRGASRSRLNPEQNVAHEIFVSLGLEGTNDTHLSEWIHSHSVFYPLPADFGIFRELFPCLNRQINRTSSPLLSSICSSKDLFSRALKIAELFFRNQKKIESIKDTKAFLFYRNQAISELLLGLSKHVRELERVFENRQHLEDLLLYMENFEAEMPKAPQSSLLDIPYPILAHIDRGFGKLWSEQVIEPTKDSEAHLLGALFSSYFHQILRGMLDPIIEDINISTREALNFDLVLENPELQLLHVESMIHVLNIQFLLGLLEKRIHYPYQSWSSFIAQKRLSQPQFYESMAAAMLHYSRRREELAQNLSSIKSRLEKIKSADTRYQTEQRATILHSVVQQSRNFYNWPQD